jgi:non-ribosomal peptide synthetase component E (peptide arylation enzyme)
MIVARTSRSDADRVTLDQLLRHNAQRLPDEMALVDAAHRNSWGDGRIRRMTWREVETASNAMAQRLAAFGLPSDSVAVVQGGASCDTIIAMLACVKANLIPAMAPVTWRNAEISAAVTRTGAKALIVEGRLGSFRAAESVREVAAENFSIRFVCSTGGEAPDGVIGLDDCFLEEAAEAPTRAPRFGNAAEHVAILTFDAGTRGVYPVARSHNEWLAAGLTALAEYRLTREGVILSAMGLTSLPGIAGAVIPWLMSGCRLALHQAFDRKEWQAQIRREKATHVLLPVVVADAALRDGLIKDESGVKLVSVARFGQKVPPALARFPDRRMLTCIGEAVLIGGAPDPAALPVGTIRAPFGLEEGMAVAELAVGAGRLAVRGAMTPQAPFPGQGQGAPYPVDANGFVSSGYPALQAGDLITATGPREDVITLGGESWPIAALESIYGDVAGTLSVGVKAVPDPLLGQRLVLEAVPEPGKDVSEVSLVLHAEAKGVSPLAQTSDAKIGDRRRKAAKLASVA